MIVEIFDMVECYLFDLLKVIEQFTIDEFKVAPVANSVLCLIVFGKLAPILTACYAHCAGASFAVSLWVLALKYFKSINTQCEFILAKLTKLRRLSFGFCRINIEVLWQIFQIVFRDLT